MQSFYVNSKAFIKVENNINEWFPSCSSRTTSGMCDITEVVQYSYGWYGKAGLWSRSRSRKEFGAAGVGVRVGRNLVLLESESKSVKMFRFRLRLRLLTQTFKDMGLKDSL